MSSYGGGNGYIFNSHYVGMCYPNLPHQTLNGVNLTSTPVIIKCEGEGANSTVAKCEGNNDILKVTNTPLTKSDEDMSVLNVNNAPPIKHEEDTNDQGDECASPEVDVVINNVVSSFNVRCHLNLRQIALNGAHVEYKRENGMVTMKLRRPYTTASIWSSGKITCTGATSDDDAKIASRKIARKLQQLGFRVRFSNYRVVNVLCTCIMYFGINLIKFATKHKGAVSYEPELHPGATYRIKELKATLKIFTTGSITVTAPSTRNAQLAIEHIFPLVEEFKTAKPASKIKTDPYQHLAQSRKAKYDDGMSDEENVDNAADPESDDSWE